MTPVDMVLVIVVSLSAGTIGAILGLGGGFIIVPMLLLIFGLSAQTSAGTSLLALVFTGLSGTVGYAWQRRIDYKLGVTLALASAPGAVVGSLASTYVASKMLSALFGCFMIAVALYVAFGGTPDATSATHKGWDRCLTDRDGKRFEYGVRHLRSAYPLVFLAGFIAGLFGVGGGALQVPVMILLLGVPVEIATATSALMIAVSAMTAAATHVQMGNVAYEFAPYIIVSVVLGAQIGVQVQRRTRARTLRRLFAIFLVVIGVRLVLVLLT